MQILGSPPVSGEDEVFIEAIVALAAVIIGSEVEALDIGSGCSVEDHHMVGNGVEVAAVGVGQIMVACGRLLFLLLRITVPFAYCHHCRWFRKSG
ncbi:MAG: hypothetical protein R3E39_30065 [Anaerolineae bacterium]